MVRWMDGWTDGRKDGQGNRLYVQPSRDSPRNQFEHFFLLQGNFGEKKAYGVQLENDLLEPQFVSLPCHDLGQVESIES